MLRPIAFLLTGFVICLVMGCGGGDGADQADANPPAPTTPAGNLDMMEFGGGAPGGGGAGMGGAGMAGGAGMGGGMGDDMDMEGMAGDYGMDDAAAMEADMAGMAGAYGMEDMGAMEAAYGASGGGPGSEGDVAGMDYAGNEGYGGNYGMEDQAGMIDGMEDAYGEFGAGGPGGPGGAQSREAPVELDGAAQFSFDAGKDDDALQYLMAHALTNDEAAADLLSSIQWVTMLKRPAMAVRWGVGIELTAPPKFDSDPKAIGSKQEVQGRGGRGRGGDAGRAGSSTSGFDEGYSDFGTEGGPGPGSGPGSRSTSNPTVSRYAGDLGDRLIEEFQKRVSSGAFGRVYQDAASASGGRQRGRAGGGGGGAADYGMMEDYGMEFGGGGGGPQGGGADAKPGHITTGLDFIGIGDTKELFAKAKEAGVDALVVFDVTIKVNSKVRLIINDTKVAIYNVDSKSKLVGTRPLNNMKVQNARDEEKDDGIDREIAKITEFVDQNIVMVPLPDGLNNNNVQARVSGIASARHDNLLPVLTEIKFWNRKGLLTDEGLTEAYASLLGDELGALLANGSEDEKKEVVERWLPRSQEKKEEPRAALPR